MEEEISRKESEADLLRIAGITESEIQEAKLQQVINNYYGKRELAVEFLKIQPLYYDNSRMWWYWNKDNFKWAITDEVNVLNLVNKLTSANTIMSKEKSEILEALRQEARLNAPKEIKKTWIQFKDKIVDIETGEQIEASSKYFVTNPIPFQLHPDKFINTPTMDKIFEEWVGKEYVKTLYEIIAYCCLPDYPLNLIFCFIGSGLNGKSKFLELITKFIGRENCASTELDILLNSRFELTRLYKKLICIMGETNFNEIKKSSILKKLTGGDLIGFEYKNKDLINDYNYAKVLISTNNLPTTDDKSIGFYRRWFILDFPNQFTEKKDILKDIPEEEYECLATKCCLILKDILINREFHKQGSIDDRKERFEAKSDFLQKFIDENINKDNLNQWITKADFHKKFSEWCKENHFREMAENTLGRKMKEKGFEETRKYVDWLFNGKGGQLRVWLDITWK